jgi:hypothetical protein
MSEVKQYKMIRYRPLIQNKEVKMAVDESGDWTSLTCYYTLHDWVVRLQAENERLRKAGNAMLPFVAQPPHEKGSHEAILNWQAAKQVQLTKHGDDIARGLRRKTKRNLRKGVQS